MRFYAFGNYYLSSLQQGLQAAHVVSNISTKLGFAGFAEQHFKWATLHKTIVLLNGGNSADLQELLTFFEDLRNPYAFDGFREDEQSLNGALTSVGIILPAEIYDAAAFIRSRKLFQSITGDKKYTRVTAKNEDELIALDNAVEFINAKATPWEYEMVHRLLEYQLAK